jgi:hypothetical protein
MPMAIMIDVRDQSSTEGVGTHETSVIGRPGAETDLAEASALRQPESRSSELSHRMVSVTLIRRVTQRQFA